MTESLPLPVWDERERPTTYHIDRHEPGRDYSVLPETDGGENDDYLAWINAYKEPLHDTLRAVHHQTVERLERRGIDLRVIHELVAQITERPAYPTERVVTAHDLRSDPEYIAASQADFFPKALELDGPGTIADSQFEYILHFIRFRLRFLQQAATISTVDAVAHEVGHATLAPVTYVHLDRSDSERGNVVYHWFGYTWRHNDRYCGELLDEASAAKVAAVTRRELDLVPRRNVPPMAEAYYEGRRGFSFSSVGAIALDMLGQSAGLPDTLAIYRPLWSFMVNLQDPAARDELAAIIQRGSDGHISLELLETETISSKGLSLNKLERIEEACGIDGRERPSRFIRAAGIY